MKVGTLLNLLFNKHESLSEAKKAEGKSKHIAAAIAQNQQ